MYYFITDTNTTETKCVNSSVSDFPNDLFDDYQRKHGVLILHFILSVYCFVVIAIVCDKYFLPSVECICIGKSTITVLIGRENGYFLEHSN